MKLFYIVLLSLTCATGMAADIKLSGMTATTSPSTNSLIYVVDLNATPSDRKYLLTNLVTQATLQSYAPLADPTFTGTVTMDTLDVTTLTATNWLLPVTETNKVVGIGISTNPVVATSAMVQNTLGQVYQSTNGQLTTLAGGLTGIIKGNGSTYSAASAGTDYTTPSSSDTFSNKTLDASDNTIKMRGYIILTHPHLCDGAGAIIQTNDYTKGYYGQAKFSNSGATNANYIGYRLTVPEDIDTSVDLKVERWKFRLGGADTGSQNYNIGMISVADSAVADGTPSNWVNVSFAGDASGADGDIETVSNVTLTNWKSNVTAGQYWVIRVARDGAGTNANDSSTVDSYSGPLVISYGITQ